MSDYRTLGERVIARVSNPEHRARLEGMVIDPSFADEEYIPRVLPGGTTEIELYMRAIERGKPVMLVGHAGSGKTMSPLAFASETGMPIAITEGHNGYDPETQWQYRDQNPETGIWEWQDTDAGLVWRYGGIELLDELYRIPAKSAGSLFSMLDGRRRITLPTKEVVKAADDLLIVSTTNPPDYAGVGEVDEALKDRHSPVLYWDYSAEVEAELVSSKSLRTMAKEIRDRGNLSAAMSTRNLVEFEDIAKDLGWEMAVAALLGRYVEYEHMIVGPIVANWAPKIREELEV